MTIDSFFKTSTVWDEKQANPSIRWHSPWKEVYWCWYCAPDSHDKWFVLHRGLVYNPTSGIHTDVRKFQTMVCLFLSVPSLFTWEYCKWKNVTHMLHWLERGMPHICHDRSTTKKPFMEVMHCTNAFHQYIMPMHKSKLCHLIPIIVQTKKAKSAQSQHTLLFVCYQLWTWWWLLQTKES